MGPKIVQTVPGAGGNTKVSSPQESAKTRWCFTLNNYSEKDIENLKELSNSTGENQKFIIGREIAPTTNTPHLQGYIEFGRRVRFSWLKKKTNPNIHWEAAKGDLAQNFKYCSKEGNYVTNIEEVPKKMTQIERRDFLKMYNHWYQEARPHYVYYSEHGTNADMAYFSDAIKRNDEFYEKYRKRG